MRRPRFGPRDRRAVRLGAAVLAPAFAWTFAVAPYLAAVAEARDVAAVERRRLASERALLASAATYPPAFQAGAERLLAAAPRLMAGGDDGAASAALAGYLRRLARIGRANLARVEPAAARDHGGGIRALPVAVSGEADLEGLLTFLQLIESGPRLVHVEALRVEAVGTAPGPSFAGAPAAARVQPVAFHLTATAFALAVPPPPDSAGAVESVDPVDPVHPIDSVDPVDPAHPPDPPGSVDVIGSVDSVDPVDSPGPTGSSDPADSVDPVDPIDRADPAAAADSEGGMP